MNKEITIRKVLRKNLKSDWLRLNEGSSKASPFQCYDLHEVIVKHYLFLSLAKKELLCYYAFFKENKCIMIAPLGRRITSWGWEYVSFGATPTIAFQDFIYDDNLSEEDMEACMELLKEKLGKVKFYNLPAESLLLKVLKKRGVVKRENINYTIPLKEGYDSYYSGLDKHVRQNVRTAYNRMKTDGKTWRVEVLEGKNVRGGLLKELMDLYISRRRTRYRATSRLHEWYLRHEHFNTIALQKLENARYVILLIDGKLAAFLAGYVDDKAYSLLIPRLAINDDFGRYSPGAILINESMKKLDSEMGLKWLDLSKGNDRYKAMMGGEIYNTYNIDL